MIDTDECASCILDLHSKPAIETGVLQTQITEYFPVSRLESSGPFEFIINAAGNWCTRPSHYRLYGKVKILHKDGSPVADADEVSIVNNLPGALFKQIDYSINGTTVTQSSNDQQYRTYLELLLSYNKGALESHLATSLWKSDTAGKFDVIGAANTGWSTRKAWINKDKTLEFFSTIHIDLCNQPKVLPPGVHEKMKFIRGSDTFCFLASADDYKVQFESLVLQIERVLPSDTAWLQLQKNWLQLPFYYPVNRVLMRSFTIPKGSMNHNLTNIHSGQAPNLVCLGMVSTESYNGAVSKNPFNFKHFGINYVNLTLNGEPIHNRKAFTPDFEKDLFSRSYNSIFTGTGIHHENESLSITPQLFKQGCTLFVWDLTPDLCGSDHLHPRKQGTLNLELRWKEALSETINVIIYSSFQNHISINNTGEVTSDFSV